MWCNAPAMHDKERFIVLPVFGFELDHWVYPPWHNQLLVFRCMISFSWLVLPWRSTINCSTAKVLGQINGTPVQDHVQRRSRELGDWHVGHLLSFGEATACDRTSLDIGILRSNPVQPCFSRHSWLSFTNLQFSNALLSWHTWVKNLP